MKNILIVEDQLDFQLTVKSALSNQYNLVMASTGKESLRLASHNAFDLILLDVNLPDDNGFKLIGQFRQIEHLKDTPVLFLTGNTDVMYKVAGFSLGAEDYITKPFDKMELRARVQARLKPDHMAQPVSSMMKKGRFEFHHDHTKCYGLRDDGDLEDLGLDAFEYRMLMALAQSEGQVMSFQKLKEKVWGENTEVLDTMVERSVVSIRGKLDPDREEILNVNGLGFSFRFRHAG